MSDSKRIPVVGIVGGVGSGKSTVARLFARRNPWIVIDGDRTGHRVLDQPETQTQLRASFGEEIFTPDGRVDRSRLGRRVFGPDEQSQRARRELESIVHPLIRAEFIKEIQQASQSPEIKGVLLDAAVLFEAGWNELCDAVVHVSTPPALRLERVQSGRGWSPDELTRREGSQWPVEEKQRRSDFTLDNSGTPEQSAEHLERILRDLLTHSSQPMPMDRPEHFT